jgi:outer membrane receptor protein involved in Fe transport
VSGDTIKEKYTTQDTPELLKAVPGVFSRSSGLGESDLTVRGFDSERVQIMINNVPVNDPESQVVYWSNWTGLSGNAGSIQVQKGVGSSLYGSGAFGGSVNIETDNFSVEPSTGLLLTGADTSGNSHFVAAVDFSSGFVMDDKVNFYGRYERKDGDSYINGTNYDGHSLYFGTLIQSTDSMSWTINLHGAPQKHNQAGNVQNPELLEQFGRQWNRRHHEYQENYYFKPVFEVHHDWTLNSQTHWRTTFFMTKGTGGGRYLRNDKLNGETGEVVTVLQNDANLGRTDGSENFRYTDRNYTPASGIFNNSWRNDSNNNHQQFGANTSYKKVFSDRFTMVTGGEIRIWEADHYADTELFEFGNESSIGGTPETLAFAERRYDYKGKVDNYSVYIRGQWSPNDSVTIMADVGYLGFKQSIDENAIHQYDFYNRAWTDLYARATSDTIDGYDASGGLATGTVVAGADSSLYSRDYDFIQPKLGLNWNINSEWNMFVNASQAKKEPQVGDWYNRSSVPLSSQELKEETLLDLELGFGYRTRKQNLSLNLYSMTNKDRIETTYDNDIRYSQNVGKAKHEGLEIGYNLAATDNLTFVATASFADNTWEDLDGRVRLSSVNYDPEDLIGKHVPGSPESQIFLELNYRAKNWNVYANYNWWDNYYVIWDNSGLDYDGDPIVGIDSSSRLPTFSELGVGGSYNLQFGNGNSMSLSLRGFNVTGHEHFNNAVYGRDYGRYPNGPYLGVAQSPEAQWFATMDVNF